MGVAIAIVVVVVVLVVAGAVLVVRRRGRTTRGPAAREAEVARPAPREPELTAPPTVPPEVRVPVREGLGARIRGLFAGKAPTEEEWRRLEEVLVRADVGPHAAKTIVDRVKERYDGGDDDPARLIADEIAAVLAGDAALNVELGRLSVVMVVGVNGSGKTTSIGKLASRLSGLGYRVSLANSDTFRAAAAEQIGIWAERTGAHLVSQSRGADPGAVAFDAVQAARARGSDVLIVDTAGRLHTRTPLMDELAKVRRVVEKAHGGVDEVLLVLDATTGQNGIQQARVFTEAVGVTGVILTKLDGTARGGIVVAVRDELGVPVKLVGTGEGTDDLEPFDPHVFAAALVA